MNANIKTKLTPIESLRAAADWADDIYPDDVIGISLDRIDGNGMARVHVLHRALPQRILPTVTEGIVATRYEVDMGGFVVFSLIFKE